ncbi:MAG: type II secretion system GspH family protein [Magnetococcus sp. YQC-5]
MSRPGYQERGSKKTVSEASDRRSFGASGFTLLEMIMVVVMLGLLAFYMGMASPNSINRVALARQLVNDIRLAQAYALNYNPSVGASIVSTGSNTYNVCTPTAICTSMTLGDAIMTSFNLVFDGYGSTSNATITVTMNGTTTIQVTGATGLVQVLP